VSEHPPEDALAAFAEADPGAGDGATREHVASCAACQGRIAGYGATLSVLERFSPLGRRLCPEPTLLAASVDGTLARGESAALDRHLAACPLCREDRADLEALLQPGPLAVLVRWLEGKLTLVENTLGALAPSPAPVLARGEAGRETIVIARELPGARLEVALVPARAGVDAQVSLRSASGALPRFRVELARGGALVEGREGATGTVVLDGLTVGRWELVVFPEAGPACEIALEIAG
jgi:hypothetical protein